MKVLSLKTALTVNTARMQATHTKAMHTRMNMATLMDIHMTKPTSTNMGTHTISHMCTGRVAAIRTEPQQCAVIGLI